MRRVLSNFRGFRLSGVNCRLLKYPIMATLNTILIIFCKNHCGQPLKHGFSDIMMPAHLF